MASKTKLVFWTFILTLGKMDSSCGQRLGSLTDTCNVQTKLDDLQQIVKNQAITIEILKEEIGSVKELYKSRSSAKPIYGSNGIEDRLVKISNTISKIESKQNLQQSTIQRFETRQSVLERKIDRDVAFTARLTYGNSISNLIKHKRIVFGATVTNRGNAYDGKTGIFRCPKDGLYGFYFNLSTEPDKFALIELNKNDAGWYARAYANKADGSTFVVLSLVKGDMIWLRASKNCSTGEVLKYALNTFSGFLIHAY